MGHCFPSSQWIHVWCAFFTASCHFRLNVTVVSYMESKDLDVSPEVEDFPEEICLSHYIEAWKFSVVFKQQSEILTLKWSIRDIFPRTARWYFRAVLICAYYDEQWKEEKKEKACMRDVVGLTCSKQSNRSVACVQLPKYIFLFCSKFRNLERFVLGSFVSFFSRTIILSCLVSEICYSFTQYYNVRISCLNNYVSAAMFLSLKY